MATTVNSRHTEPNGGTLGPRKTLIIMVTVVGCIAILWPKVFYPMMVGPTQTKTVIKDHRGSGCCDVVLDQEETFANMSINVPNQQNLFRKRNIGPTVEDHSIRQERPPHLRPETIHPAMRERGRAIPHVGSTHSERPQSPPRIVEGRPGPIPGMRPPMGAGSHQSTKSANSMGFIMPLYTIGIVSFFIYTILKLIFKKTPATPYPEIKPDTTFRNEVFTAPDQPYIKRPDSGTTKLGQPIANGENGAPASVGPVSNGSASASFNHSVQAEISVDYQQLAAQSESRPATTDSSVAEEQVTEITTPVEQDKSEASSASEATNDDECVQPEYDPATEKVVDGIVVQKIVQLNEEESTSKVIERVASQVVDEVLQEAESKINEAAEAAAVELVEMVVEQAEAAVLAAELDGIEEIEQFVKYVEESATVEENMKIDQPSVSVEEPIEEAETVEETPVTEDIVICHEPVLDTNAVAESSETKEVTFADNGPQLISDELSELKQDIETNSEIAVCQNVSETEQTVKVSESIEVTSKPENVEASEQENIFTFDSNKICDEKLSESPIELVPELETSIEVSISETLSSEEPVSKEKTLKEVIVDTIEENITVPNEPEAIEVEDKMSEPLEDSEKLTPAQEVAVEGVEEETVETTKSTEIEMEQEVEIPVDDEATADEVIQVLKEVLHSSAGHEEPQQISNEEQIAESPISEVTEPTQECEVDATASEGLETVDDENEITQETPTDTETVLTPTETETVETENVKGVTFADEVVVDTSKDEDLEEQVSEEIPLSEKTTTSDESLDTEEMAIKVLAAKMEETIAEQAEEIEVRSIAEELVNEVLEQAEEIANEKVALDSYELPSYDPATQKLVDGEVINRYVSDGEASNVAASTPVVEEVVESVSIEQVSAVCAEALGSAPENTLPSENDTDQLTSDITEESQPFEQETRQIVEDNVIVIKETVVESSGDVKLPVDNAEVAVSVDQHITLDNINDNAHINEENQENIHSSEASVEPSIIETTFTDLKEGVKIKEPVEQAVEEMAHDSAPQEQIVEEVPQDEVELEATETISVNEQSEGEATSLSEEPTKSEVVESESADEILIQEEAHQDTSSEHVGVDHENESIEARDCKVSTEINLPEHMSVVEQEITVEEASAESKNDESSEAVETLSVSPELSTCETSMTIEDTTLPDCTVVQESLFEVQAAPEASDAPFESSVLEIISSEATVELVAPDVKETKDVTAFKETTENKLCKATVELVAPDVEETKAVTELKETTENKLDTVAPETTTDAPVEEQTAVAVEADASVEAVPSVDACNEDETLKIETDVTTETDETEQVGTEESFSDSPGEMRKEEPILESSAFVQIESTSADVGSDEQTGTVEDLKEPELENVSDSATKEVEPLTESLEHKVVDGEAADINELEPIVNEAQDSNESQTFETVAEELPVTKDAEDVSETTLVTSEEINLEIPGVEVITTPEIVTTASAVEEQGLPPTTESAAQEIVATEIITTVLDAEPSAEAKQEVVEDQPELGATENVSTDLEVEPSVPTEQKVIEEVDDAVKVEPTVEQPDELSEAKNTDTEVNDTHVVEDVDAATASDKNIIEQTSELKIVDEASAPTNDEPVAQQLEVIDNEDNASPEAKEILVIDTSEAVPVLELTNVEHASEVSDDVPAHVTDEAIVVQTEVLNDTKDTIMEVKENVTISTSEQNNIEQTNELIGESNLDATNATILNAETNDDLKKCEIEEAVLVENETSDEQQQHTTAMREVNETIAASDDVEKLDDLSNTVKSEDKVPSTGCEVEAKEEDSVEQTADPIVSENIITTETVHHVMSTEPVILSEDETSVEVVSTCEPSELSEESSSKQPKAESSAQGPSIEEVHDETVVATDEGRASEEFVVKVEVEKPDTSEMISEVIEECVSSPVCTSETAAPVLDIIMENQEDVESTNASQEITEATFEQVGDTKEKLDQVAQEALVERTLTEATAVATEIESIVDHIITEKIMHAIPSEVCTQDVALDKAPAEIVSEPEKLAFSAAKVVDGLVCEEIVSATSSATLTVPASSSCPTEANNSINQLITASDTNQPESPSIQSPPTTLPYSSPAVDANSSENEKEDDSIVRDAPISNLNFAVVEGTQKDAAQHDTSSNEPITSSFSTTSTSLEQSPEAISIGISSSSSRATIVDQVPTSVSNVTNPKFLTLNLVNYSPSGSSGNNSNSSALIQSRNAAGTADVVAAVASDSSEQLMELDLLRRKLDETEQAMAKIIANMGAIPKGQETEETDNTQADEKVPEQNGHVCKPVDSTETVESEPEQQVVEKHEELEHDENYETAQHQSEAEEDIPKIEQRHDTGAVPKKREISEDRSSLKVIPMEKKVAYEPGQHSSRPGTPAQFVTLDPTIIEADAAESKCILLDAAKVPQSSKVTIPESELALETIDASQKSSEETPFDLNLVVVFESLSNLNQGRSLEVNVLLGSEPTTTVVQPSPAARVASPTREVVLSGMMKLSLVKLDDNEKNAAGDVVLKAKDVKKGDTYDGTFGPNEE